MISMQGGHFVPIPFTEMIDPKTGRTRVRLVDIHSTRYAIARRYMIRLRRDDFDDPHELAKLAATAGMSLQEFRQEFEYLVQTSRRRSRWTRGWAGSWNQPPHRGASRCSAGVFSRRNETRYVPREHDAPYAIWGETWSPTR